MPTVDRVAGLGRMEQVQLNRADRLEQVLERDGTACVWCGRRFGPLVRATTDHLVPRIKGGPSWLENEVAACRRCNGERGHQSPATWATECEGRGWPVERALVRERLVDLDRVIRQRGGQRRARDYVDGQLRRLR